VAKLSIATNERFQNNVVPLGTVLPLAAFVLKAFVGRDGKFRHGCAAGSVFNLRIFAQIADQLNSIQTFACHDYRSFCLFAENRLTPPEHARLVCFPKAGGKLYQKQKRSDVTDEHESHHS
jgi:hypothetical protein